jgi:hypothetical protein
VNMNEERPQEIPSLLFCSLVTALQATVVVVVATGVPLADRQDELRDGRSCGWMVGSLSLRASVLFRYRARAALNMNDET